MSADAASFKDTSHRPCSSIGLCRCCRSVSLISRSGLHPLSLCLAPELEVGAVLLGAAVVCERQEIERFRLALAPVCSALGSVPAELDKAGFLPGQAERQLGPTVLETV